MAGRPSDPAQRPHQSVQRDARDQAETAEQQGKAVEQAPERELGDIQPEIAPQQRARRTPKITPCHASATAGPQPEVPSAGQQTRAATPVATAAPSNASAVSASRNLEVGDVPADLYRPDRPIDDQEMADEPGRRDKNPPELQREPEQAPVGEEADGRRRDFLGPPAIGQEAGGPAAGEEEHAQTHRAGLL